MKKCENGMGVREHRNLDQGEESFKWNWKHMKSVFFFSPPRLPVPQNAGHILWRDHQSETGRAWEGGRERDSEKPHETRPRLHLSFWPLQFSITKIVVTCEFDPHPPSPLLQNLPIPPFRPFCQRHSSFFFFFCLNINIYIGKWGNRGKSWGDSPHAAPEHLSLTSASWCMSAKKKSKKKRENSRNWCKKLV